MSALPGTPYKGLAAFDDSELDALLFFGREREREAIVANLLASKLTVLYVPSGVGKLFAIGREGNVKWTAQTGPNVKASPAVGPDATILPSDCRAMPAVCPPGSTTMPPVPNDSRQRSSSGSTVNRQGTERLRAGRRRLFPARDGVRKLRYEESNMV